MKRTVLLTAVILAIGLMWLASRPSVASVPGRVISALGSCCGSVRSSTAVGALGALEQAAVTAKVTNFGCHIQADIYKAGQRVKSYALRGGQWDDIR